MPSAGGYAYCACRDCCEVTMATGLPEHEQCHACRAAGCEDGEDCSAPHAYCEGDSRCEEDHYRADHENALVHSGPDAWERAQEDCAKYGKGLVQICGVCGQDF